MKLLDCLSIVLSLIIMIFSAFIFYISFSYYICIFFFCNTLTLFVKIIKYNNGKSSIHLLGSQSNKCCVVVIYLYIFIIKKTRRRRRARLYDFFFLCNNKIWVQRVVSCSVNESVCIYKSVMIFFYTLFFTFFLLCFLLYLYRMYRDLVIFLYCSLNIF